MSPIENSVAFFRMAAVQLRRLAECSPEVAAELRDLAGDLDEEAIGLGGEPRKDQNTG